MRTIFWAIKGEIGLYCGTSLTRADAIARHVHGRFRWTEGDRPALNGKLFPMQKADWERCRALGDRAVRVRVEEIEE